MTISAKTVSKCLEWAGCDVHTLLYIIELEGTDEVWSDDLLVGLLKEVHEARQTRDDPDAFTREFLVPALREIFAT